MAGLVASVATSNTYSPRAWYAAEVRSVTMGRTMVRCSVDMDYFPFFFFGAAFFTAEVFFAAFFFGAAAFAFTEAALDLDLDSAFAFFAGFSSPSAFAAAFFFTCGAGSFSTIGVSVWPMAVASMSTTSDHSRWYVETSEYGSTSTRGRLRPLR